MESCYSSGAQSCLMMVLDGAYGNQLLEPCWKPTMNASPLKLKFHRVLPAIVLLALPLITTVWLVGDEPKSGKAKNPTSNVVDSANLSRGDSSAAERTQQETKELTALLRALTDRELVAIAQGGEPPAKISQLIDKTSARMNEELLAELARRWDRQSRTKIVAEKATEDVAASEATIEDKDADDQPPMPIVVKLDDVVVEAVSGTPMSVGVMELMFTKGHGPILYPDQPLYLDISNQRAHYVTFDVSYQERQDESPWQVDRIRVSFLLRGDGPAQLTLAGVEGLRLDPQEVEIIKGPARHRELLETWWKGFSDIPQDLDTEQKMLKESLLDILARRLRLPGPWPRVENKDPKESLSLESQFERAIGMLFGIESVKLAMQEDATLSQSRRHEKANSPIPQRPRMRSIVTPSVPASTWIEPIAMHVPAECFYLRTGNLANYRYFREFLLGWGGSLDDIVATRSLDHQTRHKIESQLGLNPEDISANQFDKLVSDMALIGCDPLFADGAAVGLLFRARDTRGLYDVIKGQRNQVKLRVPESTERRVDVGTHAVSLLASDDNRVRSFYAIDGEYHLVTNSRYLLDRFFDAGQGDRSLGSLQEFRYARSKTNEQRQTTAFLYLSDPFFQNLVSPHYRIEVTRRRQAARELKQFQLARLVAKAELVNAESIDDLIEARFLPAGFANRPDDSYPMVDNGQVTDSLRGSPGVFLPVPDVQLQKATPSEVASYSAFVDNYNAEWKRVDPVTVVFARDGAAANDLGRVNMDIIITPYAARKYSLLQRHLAAASKRRVAHVDGDLLSVDTAIRTGPGRQAHLLYLGLRDDDVPFTFKNGQVELVDRRDGKSFAKSRSFAAISPPSTDVLRLLASVLQGKPSAPAPARQARSRPVPPPKLPIPMIGNAIYYFGLAFGTMSPNLAEIARYTSTVDTRDGWSVASTNDQIRQDTLDELAEEWINNPSQVRMRMGSLSGSRVEPYIQAYTYLEARRVSGENARFLNDFAQWLQVPPKEARDTAEDLLGARIHCPLGGDFKFENIDGHQHWGSTSWSEASLYSVTKTPESWRFPFLDWIRRLDLRFDLDRTTLRAHVDLLVHQTGEAANDGQLVAMQMVDPKPNVAASNVRQAAFHSKTKAPNRAAVTQSAAATPAQLSPVIATEGMPPRVAPLGRDTRKTAPPRTWILGVRVSAKNQSMQVTHVYANSPASRVGIRVDDVIRMIDHHTPRNNEHLRKLLESTSQDGVATVRVLRQGSNVTFDVPLGKR